MSRSEYRILIVEDNPTDVAFLRRALRDDGLMADIVVVNDADRAVEYLERCTEATRPDLAVIDINLPKLSGIEVLHKCRFAPSLADMKTMILTSSDDPSDHCRADLIGANAYVRKPRALSEFAAVARTIRTLLDLHASV